MFVCTVQDGRSAEIAAIRSGYGDVVEIVTRVNRVRFFDALDYVPVSELCLSGKININLILSTTQVHMHMCACVHSFLPTSLATEVMQSPPSVCRPICFHSVFRID